MVCAIDLHIPEQIGVGLVPWLWFGGPGLAVDCLYAHLAHQRADMAPADVVTQIPEFVSYPSAAQKRPLQMDLVDKPHQFKIAITFANRLIVEA